MSDKGRWNEDREKRARDRRERDEADELRAETERRGDELKEAWREHHPQGGRGEPKGGKR